MKNNQKEKAKEVPITSLYHGHLFVCGYGKLRGKCPFHKDSEHPNFFVYTKTNSWYCFAGCGGGDVISFIMKLKGVDFKQALEILAP